MRRKECEEDRAKNVAEEEEEGWGRRLTDQLTGTTLNVTIRLH